MLGYELKVAAIRCSVLTHRLQSFLCMWVQAHTHQYIEKSCFFFGSRYLNSIAANVKGRMDFRFTHTLTEFERMIIRIRNENANNKQRIWHVYFIMLQTNQLVFVFLYMLTFAYLVVVFRQLEGIVIVVVTLHHEPLMCIIHTTPIQTHSFRTVRICCFENCECEFRSPGIISLISQTHQQFITSWRASLLVSHLSLHISSEFSGHFSQNEWHEH